MNKAKEYEIKVGRDLDFDAIGDSKRKVAKTMNHKTLEDAKELIEDEAKQLKEIQKVIKGSENKAMISSELMLLARMKHKLEKLKL